MESGFGLLSVSVVLAVLLSIVAEWFPGFSGWWEALSSGKKAQLMALGVLLITVGLSAARCYLYDGVCPANWAQYVMDTLAVAFLSLGGNQGAYLIIKALRQE